MHDYSFLIIIMVCWTRTYRIVTINNINNINNINIKNTNNNNINSILHFSMNYNTWGIWVDLLDQGRF